MRAAVLNRRMPIVAPGWVEVSLTARTQATISPIEPERRDAHALTMHAEDCHRVNSASHPEWISHGAAHLIK